MSEPDDLNALQLEKLRLENEKLRIETYLLKRPAWRQASYIAAILPVAAIVATGWITGWITYSNSEFKRDADLARKEVAELRPLAAALKKE
jgi:hypothetical protein